MSNDPDTSDHESDEEMSEGSGEEGAPNDDIYTGNEVSNRMELFVV